MNDFVIDISDLPDLTDEEEAAFDALGEDFIERLIRGQAMEDMID